MPASLDHISFSIEHVDDAYSYATHIVSYLRDSNCYDILQECVAEQSELDDTFKYWSEFVLVDCHAYIQLYLAIQSGNWDLRVSAIKVMAPLFSAFDQTIYQELIPYHLADIKNSYPDEILNCFKAGGFTVSLTGQPWNNIGLDEAHEMKINL